MEKVENNCTENKKTVDDITNGIGIFCGQPEITGRMGCLIVSVVCVISTIALAFNSFGAESLMREDIILSIIFILITLLVVFLTVFSFTYPYRTRRNLIFNGIWLSKNEVWLGEHEIELHEKCSINNLMNKDFANTLQANWKHTKRVSCLDISDISMALQIVNSEHDDKDYRIDKIHIFNEKDCQHFDFVAAPTILMINGILYPCNTLTLIGQLRKIAIGIKGIQKKESLCTLAVTQRRDTSGNSSDMMESGGELNNIVENKSKAQQTMSILQKGKFIDKENSDFLISLSKDFGWKIEFGRLAMDMRQVNKA